MTQYPIPITKPGWPLGSLDLEIDRDDNIWLGMMYQASIARFDQKTETFKMYSIPKEWDSEGAQFGHLAVNGTHVDGKVWVKNSDGTKIYRLDLATEKWEDLGAPSDPRTKRRIGTYGIHADTATNDAYLLDFAAGNIVKIDAKTKVTTVYLTPSPNSTPRRGRVDSEGRVWFAEYRADRIGMLDPKTAQIVEWKVPTDWSAPYDAMFSRHGHAWTGSMVTDRVARLDVETGQYTEYTLPRPTNIRRVYRRRPQQPRPSVDRQQPWRIDRQGRAARLAETTRGEDRMAGLRAGHARLRGHVSCREVREVADETVACWQWRARWHSPHRPMPRPSSRSRRIEIPGTPIENYGVLTIDQATGLGYLADKDNKAVVVFDTKTDKYVTRIGGFVGMTRNGNASGPNGLADRPRRRRAVGERRRFNHQGRRPQGQRDHGHDRDRRQAARQRHGVRSATNRS